MFLLGGLLHIILPRVPLFFSRFLMRALRVPWDISSYIFISDSGGVLESGISSTIPTFCHIRMHMYSWHTSTSSCLYEKNIFVWFCWRLSVDRIISSDALISSHTSSNIQNTIFKLFTILPVQKVSKEIKCSKRSFSKESLRVSARDERQDFSWSTTLNNVCWKMCMRSWKL